MEKFYFIYGKDIKIKPLKCENSNGIFNCTFRRSAILSIDTTKSITLNVVTKSGIQVTETRGMPTDMSQVDFCRRMPNFEECMYPTIKTTKGTEFSTIYPNRKAVNTLAYNIYQLQENLKNDNIKYENKFKNEENEIKKKVDYFSKKYDENLNKFIININSTIQELEKKNVCINDKTGLLNNTYIKENFYYKFKKFDSSEYKKGKDYFEAIKDNYIVIDFMNYDDIDKYVNVNKNVEVYLKHKKQINNNSSDIKYLNRNGNKIFFIGNFSQDIKYVDLNNICFEISQVNYKFAPDKFILQNNDLTFTAEINDEIGGSFQIKSNTDSNIQIKDIIINKISYDKNTKKYKNGHKYIINRNEISLRPYASHNELISFVHSPTIPMNELPNTIQYGYLIKYTKNGKDFKLERIDTTNKGL